MSKLSEQDYTSTLSPSEQFVANLNLTQLDDLSRQDLEKCKLKLRLDLEQYRKEVKGSEELFYEKAHAIQQAISSKKNEVYAKDKEFYQQYIDIEAIKLTFDSRFETISVINTNTESVLNDRNFSIIRVREIPNLGFLIHSKLKHNSGTAGRVRLSSGLKLPSGQDLNFSFRSVCACCSPEIYNTDQKTSEYQSSLTDEQQIEWTKTFSNAIVSTCETNKITNLVLRKPEVYNKVYGDSKSLKLIEITNANSIRDTILTLVPDIIEEELNSLMKSFIGYNG